ncbi:MAG: PRC-barrel domain-containing protein [Candidatus Angelobacter sp.]
MRRLLGSLVISVTPLMAMPGAIAQTTGAQANPPVAGATPLGVTVTEMEAVVVGWSAKRDLLGKTVTNDKKERIGKIDDIIVAPSSGSKMPHASVAIIGVGGFLGMGRHDVAIPTEQIRIEGNNLVLPGASKDALKAVPEFQYARKK